VSAQPSHLDLQLLPHWQPHAPSLSNEHTSYKTTSQKGEIKILQNNFLVASRFRRFQAKQLEEKRRGGAQDQDRGTVAGL
jgi:hypothetical protein